MPCSHMAETRPFLRNWRPRINPIAEVIIAKPIIASRLKFSVNGWTIPKKIELVKSAIASALCTLNR